MTLCETPIPDLLRRFVATPHRCSAWFNGVNLELHTNDRALSDELLQAAEQKHPDTSAQSLLVKMVRDDQAPDIGSEITVLSSGPLVTVLKGSGTMLCLDCERGELLGFLAPHVTAREWVDQLLSLVLDRFRKRASSYTFADGGEP